MNSNSKEPVRTGNKIKRGEAFDKTPSRATAPAGGCKQAAPRRLPNTRFLGCRGLTWGSKQQDSRSAKWGD